MSNASRSWSDQELIDVALRTVEIKLEDRDRACLLFSDYLHLLLSGKKEIATQLSPDQLSNVAYFAKASSFSDLDDVNWKLLIHPGSIIFSALLPHLFSKEIDSQSFLRAVIAGYHGSSLFAQVLQPSHSRNWHASATSGIFGAALATANLLELSDDKKAQALHFASAAIGGGANASRSQNGATRFTRIHAALMGTISTLEAAESSPAPLYIVDGPGGLSERFGVVDQLPITNPSDALHQISLRYYPYSGFSHNALENLAAYLPLDPKSVKSIELQLNEPLYSIVGSSTKGPWWDLSAAIVNTIASGDPFDSREGDIDPDIKVEKIEAEISLAKIKLASGEISFEFGIQDRLGIEAIDIPLVQRKWSSLYRGNDELTDIASQIIDGSESAIAQLKRLILAAG
ncbi:MAG: MmgE/PrpD family protein [Candidatus Planktophila sp.]|nr:MmgE/PrpD family protein [Candidatus Planktophila sp.]